MRCARLFWVNYVALSLLPFAASGESQQNTGNAMNARPRNRTSTRERGTGRPQQQRMERTAAIEPSMIPEVKRENDRNLRETPHRERKDRGKKQETEQERREEKGGYERPQESTTAHSSFFRQSPFFPTSTGLLFSHRTFFAPQRKEDDCSFRFDVTVCMCPMSSPRFRTLLKK